MLLTSSSLLGYGLDFKGNLNPYNKGFWTSPWFDTEAAGLVIDWVSATVNNLVPSGCSWTLEFRTATQSNKADATAYAAIGSVANGQYIQAKITAVRDDSATPPVEAYDIQPVATSLGYGAMFEEGTTNLVNYSEDFSNAYWTKANCSVVANQAIAPDGTLTADKFVENAGSGWKYASKGDLLTASQAGTISVFAKAGERTRVWLSLNNIWAIFDLTDGSVVATFGSPTSTDVKDYGNGWYRCSVTVASVVSTDDNFMAGPASGSTGSYTGDGVSGIYLWGAQAEVKPYPTSYIPATGGATATRNAESLAITTANVIDYSKGSAFFKVYISGDLLPGTAKANHYLFHPGTGAADNFAVYRAISTASIAFTFGASGSITNLTWATDLTQGWHTLGIRWDSSEISIWANGVKKASAVPTSLPAVLQTLTKIGCAVNDTVQWGAPIAEVCIYNEALTDAQMLAEGVNTSTNVNADFKMKFETDLAYDARTNELTWTSDRLDSIVSQVKTGLT